MPSFISTKARSKVTVCSELGKEAVVAILGRNEFFGEGCLAGQKRRIATVTAISDCEVMRIQKATIAHAIGREHTLSTIFTDYLLARTIRVEEDLVDQLFNSSEKRLARALLMLASFDKDGPPDKIIAKVSQETLAEMIGTTRARVSFFMNKFRKLGYIDYNGNLEVHKSLLNFLLREQPPHIQKKASGATLKKSRGHA
jgi:CRP/FNR family cyclic AMP-dependent transcriptional regulator